MNSHFSRSRALIFAVAACLWLAVIWAGFQGIENRFGPPALLAALVFVACAQAFRSVEVPLLIAVYIHAISTWSLHPAISALFAASPLVLMQSAVYLSIPRATLPWEMEAISFLAFDAWVCLNIAVLTAGFEGIEKGVGLAWAVVAVAALMCRFSIGVFAVGAYFHATNSWSWNPAMAVLFAASPGICFLIECRINQLLFLGPLPFLGRIRRWS
jgi:hypothetical protein